MVHTPFLFLVLALRCDSQCHTLPGLRHHLHDEEVVRQEFALELDFLIMSMSFPDHCH